MTITNQQARTARKLLGWSSVKTAVRSNVGVDLIKKFEGGRRKLTQDRLKWLRSTFEAAGVEFIADSADGPGVRLRTSSDEEAIPPIPPEEPYDGSPV